MIQTQRLPLKKRRLSHPQLVSPPMPVNPLLVPPSLPVPPITYEGPPPLYGDPLDFFKTSDNATVKIGPKKNIRTVTFLRNPTTPVTIKTKHNKTKKKKRLLETNRSGKFQASTHTKKRLIETDSPKKSKRRKPSPSRSVNSESPEEYIPPATKRRTQSQEQYVSPTTKSRKDISNEPPDLKKNMENRLSQQLISLSEYIPVSVSHVINIFPHNRYRNYFIHLKKNIEWLSSITSQDDGIWETESTLFFGIFFPKKGDSQYDLIRDHIRQKKKIILVMPWPSVMTTNFIAKVVGENISDMTIFMPYGGILYLGAYRCVIIGFHICSSSLVFLKPSADCVSEKEKTVKDVSRDDEYYTFPGTWDFLKQLPLMSRYKKIFQSFRGKDHLLKQLKRLFPNQGEEPQRILSMPLDFRFDRVKSSLDQDYTKKFQQSDIIITNPPFGLKYSYISYLVEKEKPFILLLPQTCVMTCDFRNAFRTKENLKKVGFIIPLQRIHFLIPKSKPKPKQHSREPLTFDDEYNSSRVGFDTIYVSWNIPELEGKAIFLNTTFNERYHRMTLFSK